VHENINGDRSLVAIERAIHELRCGRAVYCRDANAAGPAERGALLACAETASAALLAALEQLAGVAGLTLALTRERAETLGLTESGSSEAEHEPALSFRLRPPAASALLDVLAGVEGAAGTDGSGAGGGAADDHLVDSMRRALEREPCGPMAAAGLILAKQARLLPAVLVAPSPVAPAAHDVLEIFTTDLERLTLCATAALESVSAARVPLAGHENTRLVLFRDRRDASEHVAVVIGTPDPAAVPVRLHSACLTGDLLGSLRCDCGDQLRGAVDQLAAAGGGVLLYLAQEGRGIGLANKLRAYELQDTGLDTIEADRPLGVRADERGYAVAASMLRHLGMTRIRLLTNNLSKIEALQSAGIEVVGGQRLHGAVNRHNVRYIRAKRERAGHLMPDIKIEGL